MHHNTFLEKLEEIVERFAGFGLPLHFTENTLVSGHIMPAHIVDLNDYQIPALSCQGITALKPGKGRNSVLICVKLLRRMPLLQKGFCVKVVTQDPFMTACLYICVFKMRMLRLENRM